MVGTISSIESEALITQSTTPEDKPSTLRHVQVYVARGEC